MPPEAESNRPSEPASFEWRPYRAQHRRDQDDAAHAELAKNGVQTPARHALAPENEPEVIDTPNRLGPAVDILRDAGVFGFDTEFIGEESYHPRICVIQAATVDQVEVIDALADYDLSAFWELIVDPGVRKLVHAGAQDLEPAVRLTGRPPAAVTDTQIASAFAGFAYPVSLAALSEQLIGVELGKGLKFSKWDRRPLSDVQLHYAANDVRYLPAIAEALEDRLASLGNAELAQAACDELCQVEPYVINPLERKFKARGVRSMGRKKRAGFEALVLWREALARRLDAPPRSLVADQVLCDLAAAHPEDKHELKTIKGLPRPVRKEFGPEMIEVIDKARKGPLPPRERQEPGQTDEDRARIDAVWEALARKCADRRIDPRALTSKKDLGRVCLWRRGGGKGPKPRVLTGWRRDFLGDAVAEMDPDSA
ncbi:MAG: HRDC domain-containing protein [Planctomycetota bacterium]